MIKKCSEFQKVYEQYKVPFSVVFSDQAERETRLSKVRSDIEDEKKRLDLSYRSQAQEMKRKCQEQLKQLEVAYGV